MPIEHRWITKAILNAQKKVEGHNYDIRKHLLEYDDVMNEQRKIVYAWRKEVLSQANLRPMAFSMIDELAGAIAEDFFPGGKLRKVDGQPHLDIQELNTAVRTSLMIPATLEEREIDPYNDQGLRKLIVKTADKYYTVKEKAMGEETMRQLEKMILLTTIDHLWKDHLLAMDHLREGIGLQGYGQKDPLVEYKKEGFRFFQMMMGQITGDVARKLFSVQLAPQESIADLEEEAFSHDPLRNAVQSHPDADSAARMAPQALPGPMGVVPGMGPGAAPGFGRPGAAGARPGGIQYQIGPDGALIPAPAGGGGAPSASPMPTQHASGSMGGGPQQQRQAIDFANLMRGPSRMTMGRGPIGGGNGNSGGGMNAQPQSGAAAASAGDVEKVGRNDLCPCGSGKKYKKCHGA
jgi:preprotein translocase subunit SecA